MSFASGSKIWMDGPDKRAITLGTLLKSGGAGSVYQIREVPSLVAKIYHRDQPLEIYERKIKAMLSLSPNLPDIGDAGERYVQIAWPHAILRDERGKFLGFVMPSLDIRATSELEYILQERQARAEGLPVGLGAKITLAANLSAVIAELHKQHHYVVDMKPVNLRFYRRSLYMAMLDCDGFSIQGQNERFEAPQFTPDYLAPEFHANGLDVRGEEQQDRFALAVVIFQLLNFGIHPFTGRPTTERVPTDIPGRIQARAYAYGLKPNQSITPSMVSGHEAITRHLRNLFDRAFESAGTSRPSAGEWAAALKQYAQKSTGSLLVCKSNKEHQYFSGLDCAACARESLLKKARQATPVPAATNVRKPYGRTPAATRAPRLKTPAPTQTRRPRAARRPLPTGLPSNFPLPQSNTKIGWQGFYAYPIAIIAVLSFLIYLATSWRVPASKPADENYAEFNAAAVDKKKVEEITTRFEPTDVYLPAPLPNLDETRAGIFLAADSIAQGNIPEYEKAMAAMQQRASRQRGPYTSSVERYRKALSEYLSTDSNSARSIEEKQALMQAQFTKILAQDPLASDVAIELAWMNVADEDTEKTKFLFQQAIWAKPGQASAWYGLGICMLDSKADDTVIGIFTTAELLYDQTGENTDSRARVQSMIYQLPVEKQKRFAILQARAKQLAAEILRQAVE